MSESDLYVKSINFRLRAMDNSDHDASTFRSTTPMKNVRSRRSSGGLIPLPAEQIPQALDDNETEREHETYIDENNIENLEKMEDPILIQKISCGMKKIQELDDIIALKSKIAKDLHNDRMKRDGATNSTELSEKENAPSVSRRKVGRDKLFEKTNSSVNATPIGYEAGNFVQRNIVLGKDARYYHAMSQVESLRVENILENPEFDIDPYETLDNASTVDRPQSSLTGFYPDPLDLTRLVEIDKKLQKIVPESDWETKSLVWSSALPSGATTPMSSIRPPVEIDSVLESVSFELSLNNDRLKEIDEKLKELQDSVVPDDAKLDPKQLEFLLSQTIFEEQQHIYIN